MLLYHCQNNPKPYYPFLFHLTNILPILAQIEHIMFYLKPTSPFTYHKNQQYRPRATSQAHQPSFHTHFIPTSI